jgi:hypothetical protein
VNRVLLVVGVFTFASWTLIAALLLAWAPARAAAQRTVARVAAALPRSHGPASTCTETPAARPFEAEVTAGAAEFGYAFGDDGDLDGDGFSWSLGGGEPDATGSSRATRLRFRENGEEYVVRDPALGGRGRACDRTDAAGRPRDGRAWAPRWAVTARRWAG